MDKRREVDVIDMSKDKQKTKPKPSKIDKAMKKVFDICESFACALFLSIIFMFGYITILMIMIIPRYYSGRNDIIGRFFLNFIIITFMTVILFIIIEKKMKGIDRIINSQSFKYSLIIIWATILISILL